MCGSLSKKTHFAVFFNPTKETYNAFPDANRDP
jgi:hypothetical protein